MTNIDLLKKPFDEREIKSRAGAGGKTFDYVDHENVISRIMDATDDTFQWEIQDCGFHAGDTIDGKAKKGFFWCRGRLTIPELGTREGYGTQVWENEDSPKGAETDSFKRAAMRFGVALHLYEKPDNGKPLSVAEQFRTRCEKFQYTGKKPDLCRAILCKQGELVAADYAAALHIADSAWRDAIKELTQATPAETPNFPPVLISTEEVPVVEQSNTMGAFGGNDIPEHAKGSA